MAQGSARYERSAAGMVGAMIVTLLVILAFVAFRALNRDDLNVQPSSVDYLQVVEGLQGGDLEPAYPEKLPKGWQATRAVYDTENLAWELDLLTADKHYIGIRQADMRGKDLVEEYVDDEAHEGDIADTYFDTAVAGEWTPWTVDGGDRAYTTPLGMQRGDEPNPQLERGKGTTLLVFGSAPYKDIEKLIDLLVLDPVKPTT